MSASYSNIESEFIDINNRKAWPIFYQQIRIQSNEIASSFKCLEAKKPQNKTLNRYRDVNPYDHTRVKLTRGSCDYINANLVKVEKAKRRYILTQGPLHETVGHFWLMVWEQKSTAILMLNKIMENQQIKCHKYWPTEIGIDYTQYFNDVGLKLEYLSMEDNSYYIKRNFKLIDLESDESREIIQFHYTTWPDFGVPSSPTAFLEFLKVVRESGALESNVGPAIVHCSAGIGRSGTFCLVDSCLILMEKYGINAVDVKEVLFEMRRCRTGLIQTPDQLRFSYQAIIEGAKRLTNPNSDQNNVDPIYEAVNDEDGDADDSDCDDDDDEDDNEPPPPLPPPRGESLSRSNDFNDRPLPTIPNSVSCELNDMLNSNTTNTQDHNNWYTANGPPNRPLPGLPLHERDEDQVVLTESSSEEENLIASSRNSKERSLSPSQLRHRNRVEKQEKLAAQIQEMKRKQQSAESWQNTKRQKLDGEHKPTEDEEIK
ncbi:tyrosine-protein phosphatase non-receptor type 1 isoform X2 [Chrysoperla carnea]|uniref:tyrosine-protein phosphatase non-receptor type 1 isoform X2 n=1 Tax=Chrysoperla carnea TaxID=189513 RepID=UPI001D08A9C8|nr:tyrosine-protein phosphatase non-receptor type 1 isoform X2 [Chrysoperla carnea]